MTEEELIQKFRQVVREEVKREVDPLHERIDAQGNTLREETKTSLQASEERIKKEIRTSQEETIETLSDLIQAGYDLHEKRITALEEHTGLAPRKH